MKIIYRGYEIDVRRERSMGGRSMLYYSIYRISDGYECVAGCTTDSSTVREYVRFMKERIDNELAEADPWGEEANKYRIGYMQQRGAA